MDKEKIIEKIKELDSFKRNFVQTYDLIVVLKNVDVNKIQGQINGPLLLPYEVKHDQKICIITSAAMLEQAKAVADKVISPADLEKIKDENEVKKLAKEYDIFMAHQEMMPKIAKLFGKVLGPRKKMPNPKTGAIFTNNSDLKTIVNNLKRTQNIQIKDQLHIQLSVGHEKLKPEQVAENIIAALNHIISHLPGGKSSIAHIYLKKTMSPKVKIEL